MSKVVKKTGYKSKYYTSKKFRKENSWYVHFNSGKSIQQRQTRFREKKIGDIDKKYLTLMS